MGLFSNNIQQIIKSRERLQKDKWLLKYTSTYLNNVHGGLPPQSKG
ncbi:hypothetical protein MTBBW1_3240001 [Desulfamplus magnetovallimortis]|uniref:Uncharacterized protein n=1 Tax=Desulfamplus magnetovallimortis TaxID=1246637 RepID=A0A1W1HG24_9BACT|nr:hypothetical protein MTBBW1_3240001 [Desulfamplus magnetovallimortis]